MLRQASILSIDEHNIYLSHAHAIDHAQICACHEKEPVPLPATVFAKVSLRFLKLEELSYEHRRGDSMSLNSISNILVVVLLPNLS
jgi:hypothetical protein